MDQADLLAQKILEYMRLDMSITKSDVVIGMGAIDTRIAVKTAEIYNTSLANQVVFTGGYGRLSKDRFQVTEASKFQDITVSLGVPEDKILLEEKASNTGENIVLSRELLESKGMEVKSVIFVTKPYMERRVWATIKKQWPDPDIEFTVTSPNLSYEEHYNDDIPKELFINVLAGDLQRVIDYPKLGFQIKQEVPPDVLAAQKELIKLGFSKQLPKK